MGVGALLRAASLLALLASPAGCNTPAEAEPPPAEAAPPPAEHTPDPVAEHPPSPPQAPTPVDAANAATEEPDLAAGWRRWESSGQHAEDWALLTHQAIATGSPVALERSLAALGRRLSIWRGSGVPDVVTDAVRSLSSPENTWTARIDARRLLPALEVLIDAGDAAAILRLTSAQSGRAAQPGWSGSRTVAETFALVSSALPEGCIAGAPLPATVPPGSYLATCDGTPRLVVLPR